MSKTKKDRKEQDAAAAAAAEKERRRLEKKRKRKEAKKDEKKKKKKRKDNYNNKKDNNNNDYDATTNIYKIEKKPCCIQPSGAAAATTTHSSSLSSSSLDGKNHLIGNKNDEGTTKATVASNIHNNSNDITDTTRASSSTTTTQQQQPRPMVESSALPNRHHHHHPQQQQQEPKTAADGMVDNGNHNDPCCCVTLLLFYQYVEPAWDEVTYKHVLQTVRKLATQYSVTGRMRVAKEGLNCTLTTTTTTTTAATTTTATATTGGERRRRDDNDDNMINFCQALRAWKPECFLQTEFKLTHHLPAAQAFRDLKVIPVVELVHYGLEGAKAPPLQQYHGTHLEPAAYHKKLAERNTVVIDVRNHYEAAIGHFQPPSSPTTSPSSDDNNNDNDDSNKPKKLPPPRYIDPKWRKSTEFPVWLDKPETQEQLKGKQVLMYCTGGIRCERASALLKYKMETDPQVKNLGIQGVYQLQGGIDKYFKEFPDGGYWKGKNYVFDKRFAHAPVDKEAAARGLAAPVNNNNNNNTKPDAPIGKCEACGKNWDQFRGKRRCPTCGVPSLICRDCWQADQDGTRKLDRSIRCDLCVEQDIRSKKQLREKEKREIEEYEERSKKRGLLFPAQAVPGMTTGKESSNKVLAPNPDGVTRLFLKNMCRNNMTEDVLMDFLPGITHIVWRTDRKTGQFFGQGWVEMDSPDSAAAAVARSGEKVLGRPLYISFQKPDSKDAWPPPNSAVV